jgi:uncharacterized membrane protein
MYLWLKLLHILAVVLFLGNIITGLYWHIHASRTRDPRILAHTMAGIIGSDRLFTLPGVFLILIGGIAAAIMGNFPILGTAWIFWTLVLFSISGLAFMIRVAPLQRKLRAMAEEGARSGSFDYHAYETVARRWEIWGAVALLTPLAGLALMVLKPNF